MDDYNVKVICGTIAEDLYELQIGPDNKLDSDQLYDLIYPNQDEAPCTVTSTSLIFDHFLDLEDGIEKILNHAAINDYKIILRGDIPLFNYAITANERALIQYPRREV